MQLLSEQTISGSRAGEGVPPGPQTVGYPVLDAMGSGVILLDRERRILYWNPWMSRMAGIDVTHVSGRRLEQVFGEDRLAAGLLDGINDALTLGVSRLLSNKLHHHPIPLHRPLDAPGVLLDISVQIRPVVAGEIGCVIQINDVSAVVQRERKMWERESELRLRNGALVASGQGILIVNASAPDFEIQYANPAFASVTGLTDTMIVGQGIDALLSQCEDGPELERIRQALQVKRDVACDLVARRGGAEEYWLELSVSPVFDSTGRVSHFALFLRDVTARRMAEGMLERALSDVQATNARLNREQSFVSTVLRTVAALVVVVDRRMRVVTFNRACEQVTGYTEVDMAGAALADFGAGTDLETAVHAVLTEGSAQTLESTLTSVSGEQRLIRWAMSPLLQTGGGTISHVVCAGSDITERRRAEALLRGERELMELISRDEDLTVVAARACRLLDSQIPGAKASLMQLSEQKQLSTVAAPGLSPEYGAALGAIEIGPAIGSCGRAAYTGEAVVSTDLFRDPCWADYRSLAETFGVRACWSQPILASTGGVLGTIGIYFSTERAPTDSELDLQRRICDIVAISIERRRTVDRIRYLALYDQLTGLANRSLLSDRLMTAIRQARRSSGQLALLFLDFDGFKAINDRFGHDAGDEVLAVSGQRLRQALRESDTPARIGGDEFVVLLPDVTVVSTAAHVAEKLLTVIQEPIPWMQHFLQVGVSIGVALYPDHGDTADELLSHADDAMYAAKLAGKGRWTLFDPALAAGRT